MKRLLGVLCIFITFSVYAATFLDTENRLWFTDDIVKNAIVEFVPEDKQQSVADLYQDLMDQETGKISIDSLFKVCRKAGFNTYKYEGFTQCKDFIQKMLTDAQIAEEVNIDGFCPGLDENGNNPNKLRSITDKTRIGDFCSSTNIRMGQVIFKPGYNCSCMATVCNEGFEFQGGACVTRVADGNGDCLREVHKKTSENDNLEKCKAFCGNQYTGRACKYTSVVMSHSTGECICNPNSTEIDNALLSMQRAEERRINSLKYYKVCGDDKGKTGGTEICVEGVFNWINVGMLQAAGLAEEYARVRYNDDIACDNNYRTSWNDDYVRCTSKNSKMYYEFQFDDVKESIDADIQRGVILGICKIYNVSVGVKSCATSCTAEMVRTAQHFGLTATTNGNTCNFSGRSISADEAESKLAKIDGIDNYIFYSGIQIQGSKNVITQLKDYIKSTGKTVRSFDCIRNVDEIKNSLLVGDDDVLRCKLNGQPIDFVFDDFSESWLYVQEDGEAKIQCVVSGGKYADQECFGLTQQQCLEANAVFKKKFPSASGMVWNGKECVLLDSAEAQRYDIYVQAGIGVVAAADCLLLTHTGCLVLAVETAGLATELTTKEFIENRAGEFLAVSTRCNNRDCAIDTIRNAGKVLSVMGALDAAAANSVDSELARLVDYLEPEDLPNVSDNDWDEIIVQLGGDPDDTAGTALVWLNRIGLGAQFASLATSGYRLVSKAITRLAGKAARTANAASDAARAANAASDAGRAADAASDAGRTTGHTGNAGRGARSGATGTSGNTADAASDAGRTAGATGNAGHGSGAAGASGNAADVASEAGRSTGPLHPDIDAYRNSGDRARVRLRAKYHPDKAPSVELREKAKDIFQKIVYIDDMSEDELRALSRLMNEYDNEVVAAREAANAANAASDAGRTTNSASDAGRTTGATSNTTDVTGVTNTTSDVAQTTNATTDATRATTNAATDGARTANATADAARTTSRTTNTATDVVRSATASKYATDADANLIAKLGGADVFDSAVDGWRRDWADVAFPKSKLTDSEWNKLNQSLEKYNMEFVQGYFRNRPNDMTLVEYTPDNIRSLLEGKDIPNDAYGTLSSRPVSFKYIMDEAKTGREIFIDVGDAKEQVFQTFMRNNGLEYDRGSMKVYNPSATPLQRAKGKLYTYGQTFDKTIDDFLYRNGGYPASWRRADLTDAEFDALRADLRSHDLLLDTDPEGFLRISRISDSATNAAKTTSHATNAATDGARTANTTTDITKHSAKQIINETKEMTYAEKQSLFAALSYDKKLEIAQLKVNSGEIQLPYGLTVNDLAKNPDLLDINGSFQPFDSGLAETQRLKRLNPESQDVDNFLFDETVQKYVDNPSSKLAIKQYGQDLRTKYLEIFKEDTDLRDAALRYATLTKTDKAALGELVLDNLKGKLGIDPNTNILVMVADRNDNIEDLARQYLGELGVATTENVKALAREIKSVIDNNYMGGSWSLTADKNLIFLNMGNSQLSNFDGYMTYLSHEMGHITQTIAPEVTSAPQIMAQTANYRGIGTDYMNNAVEFESWNIQDIIGKDFTKALRSF